MVPPHESLVAELAELIAIPSVSADPAHAADVRRAAEWIVERVVSMGGTAAIEERDGSPLVIAERAATTEPATAPTVLAYAHFDVQPPDPLELWDSDPWSLDERDGFLFARGIADDKAHTFILLEATRLLAERGELPVNVRFVFDAEEEIGGHSADDWVREDTRRVDAALVWDGGYVTDELPSFCNALRGLCYFHLVVRTGDRDLHSGLYGGGALNAIHALMRIVSAVLAGPDGRLPEPLRVGIVPPTEDELAVWAELPTGEAELAAVGARPMDAGAARDFALRTTSEPTAEVNGIESGSPRLIKTVLPVEAHANLSFRLAPGQQVAEIAPEVERLLRAAVPEGADLDVVLLSSGEPARVDPGSSAIALAREAFEEVLGVRPVLARSGGSIPVVAALGARGIPAIVSGFTRPGAQLHSPNENIPASALRSGVETTIAVLQRFGRLG